MVNYKYANLFLQDSNDRQLRIEFDTGAITNKEIHSENFELSESLCSEEQLRFGSCEASSIKFKVSNIFTPLKDKWLTITETLGGNIDVPFQFGKYKVFSDKPTADRKYRDIVAYDVMHDIITADVTDWFNTILPTADSTVTLKEFRDSFLAYFGIEQEEVTLINDSMTVTKTIEPSKLSGKTVITAICEINGCFGHIGRDGRFQYIFLKEMIDGLYPSDTLYPAEDLFPRDHVNAETISKSHYISAKYEDFVTEKINKLQIRQEEDDVGATYPPEDIMKSDNCYIVQDNFLVYGKTAEELNTIAANLYSVICKVEYRPAHVEAKGNPCLEVGDGIRLATTHEIVRTYILQRTLKGIQALRDTYDAEGEQYQSEKVNSVQESIIQLKGKTNKLKRTVEETKLEIVDLEKGLSSRIIQNAESITAEVKRAQGKEAELNSKIRQSADEIRLEVTERTSMYNEEINTLQGGMDGNMDLSFFISDNGTTITTMSGKQCVNGGNDFYQDVSIPAGTYLFSYEWLRNLPLYINAAVAIYDLSINYLDNSESELYYKELGDAWLETDVWTKESFQFTLAKTTRVRFKATFSAPTGYEDRVNSLYLTNIALFGTAQSVADAITDMKTELLLQQDRILARVEKNGVVAAINMTSEEITISANKIDLKGLVNADEFNSKFATIQSLNATNATISKLDAKFATIQSLNATNVAVSGKLDANQFNATNINAMSIVAGSVAAEKITGTTISGKRFVGGEIRSNNYAASSSNYTCGNGMRIDLSNGNIWWANGSIKASSGFMNSIGYEVPTPNGGYNLNFKNALGLKSTDYGTLIIGHGFSDVELKSGASITSLAEKKKNIIPCTNALSAVKNTDVYYFNYKDDEVKRSNVQKVGFVIGNGYNLDARLLSKNGDAIDIYNAIGLNWRATQQLYEKIIKQQAQICEILALIE